MRKIPILFYLLILLQIVSCNKDFDEYYDRPSTLADPIYQQLEARGTFKSFLKLIDKSNYKSTLSSGGYWTLFAPNDSAFNVYLKENNYQSIDEVDSTTAKNIVRYLLVYNAYDSARIDDSQSTSGWIVNSSFRRKTTYYRWVYPDTLASGQVILAMDCINNTSSIDADENNNKYIPYFSDKYFSGANLPSSDYTFFYPNATFSAMNVMGSNIVGTSVFAENGYYYEINKVLEPLKNIYEYIHNNSSYSTFTGLIDKFATYTVNSDFQTRYLEATGSSATVYHKQFSSLAFSPNGECFLRNTLYDAQSDCWSILVPNNESVLAYEKNTLAEYYNHDPDQIPVSIIAEFINSHMFQTSVWPSNFNTTINYLSETVSLDINSNVTDKKILSNGIFYGVNKVHESRTFTSVYAQTFLNPAYANMLKLIATNGFRAPLRRKTSTGWTVFMVKDSAYAANNFTYNSNYSAWEWNASSTVNNELVSTAVAKLSRDIDLQIVASKLDNVMTGEGVAETYGSDGSTGECICYKDGNVWAGGNVDSSNVAKILGYRDYDNGRVYFIDKMLEYSTYSPFGRLMLLAGADPKTGCLKGRTFTEFYPYVKYILASGLLSTITSTDSTTCFKATISGVSTGSYYTFLVPNKASIAAAKTKGALFAVGTTDATELSVNNRFIKYHILNDILIVDGNAESQRNVNTAYKDLDGNTQTVTVSKNATSFTVYGLDADQTSVSLVSGSSNNLSSRAVIHLVSGYLRTE